MIWIPAATYRMGSNDHYREEAPVHAVTVDGFWINDACQPAWRSGGVRGWRWRDAELVAPVRAGAGHAPPDQR
jgi:hypothetical protein